MKNNFLILFASLTYSICFSQEEITWEDLAKVSYTDKFFPAYDDYFMYPEFELSVKELNGKQVTLTGYFLNVDPEEKLFILSKGPMSACFFCGQGGPETAVELQFNNAEGFKTDNIVSITGVFQLNKDDVDHCNYIIKNCTGKLVK